MWSLADRLRKLERELGLAAAPSPFDMDSKIIRRRVEATLSAEERERKCYMKHKIRLAAALTAVTLAFTGTALAAGPTLGEILQNTLGVYAPYAKPMKGTAEDQGIRVTLVSALADSTQVKVYFELTDLMGRGRLALMDPEMMSSHLELDIPEDQKREGVGYSWGVKRLGYDPDTQTLLAVLERNNGVLLNEPAGELRIGKLTSQRYHFASDDPVPVEKLTGSYLATQQLDTGETVLVPGQSEIELPGAQGVVLSSMGFANDGQLHFLFRFPADSTPKLSLSHGVVSVYHQSGVPYDLGHPSVTFEQDGLCYHDVSVLASPADLGDFVFSQAYGMFGSDADDIEGKWVIPFTLKQVEEYSSSLSGALGPVELKELRLSTLGVTVVTQALNDRIGGYPMWAFFSDGSKTLLDHGFTGSGGYGGPDLNRWNFAQPIEDLSSLTGVSIGCWMIPVDSGVAGEGYWLPTLPE